MRILDIIMEAPAPSGPIPPGMKWNGTMWIPDTTPSPKPDSDPTKRTPRRKTDRPPRKRRTAPPDSPDSRSVPGRKPDLWDRMKDRWSKEGQTRRYAEYVEGRKVVWINRLGKMMGWLLKAAGLITPIYTLYEELAFLEKDFVDAVEPYNTGDDALDLQTYNSHRNWLWGKFMATEGAVIGVRSIAWVIRSIFWTRFARWIIGGLSTGVTFGVGLAATIATEAGILWFSNWLQSKEGEQWWADSVIEPYLRTGGFVADTAWQGLVGAYNKTTKGEFKTSSDEAQEKREKKDKEDPDRRGQGAQSDGSATLPTKPPESQSKVNWPSHIRNWNSGGWTVGGADVTDGKGFLVPGIQNVLSVQGARREALSRKLPDPLADLPAAPGQQHPGPFVD